MATWFYTHIKKNPTVSAVAIETFIRAEPEGARSLAKLNGEFFIRDLGLSDWILITPNGFYDTTEEAGESCRRMSEHFSTTVIVTVGQGNCSGVIFATFESGTLRRCVSAADGFLASDQGEPYSWEKEIFGDLSGEEVDIFESTLERVAKQFGLSGYGSAESWDFEKKVSLSSPPPLPT